MELRGPAGQGETKGKKLESTLFNRNLIQNSKDVFPNRPAANIAKSNSGMRGLWLCNHFPRRREELGSPTGRRAAHRQGRFQDIPETEAHAGFNSQLREVCPESVGTHGAQRSTPQSVPGSTEHSNWALGWGTWKQEKLCCRLTENL